MSEKGEGGRLKSAYELALERMESQGIEPPREENLSAEVKAELAAVRQRARAKLAELEILHRDELKKKITDPAARAEAEEEYRRERERIETERDRKLAALREGADSR